MAEYCYILTSTGMVGQPMTMSLYLHCLCTYVGLADMVSFVCVRCMNIFRERSGQVPVGPIRVFYWEQSTVIAHWHRWFIMVISSFEIWKHHQRIYSVQCSLFLVFSWRLCFLQNYYFGISISCFMLGWLAGRYLLLCKSQLTMSLQSTNHEKLGGPIPRLMMVSIACKWMYEWIGS